MSSTEETFIAWSAADQDWPRIVHAAMLSTFSSLRNTI